MVKCPLIAKTDGAADTRALGWDSNQPVVLELCATLVEQDNT